MDNAIDLLEATGALQLLVGKQGLRSVVERLAGLARAESDNCLVQRDHITAAQWARRYNLLKRTVRQMRG